MEWIVSPWRKKGADVTGLDLSGPAIAAARTLAEETGIPARFVQANVYDARSAVDGLFDRVVTSWGTICWLPDIAAWARVVASLLAPGGQLYFADVHPVCQVFDDDTPGSDGMPGWSAPYFHRDVLLVDDASDHADPDARLANTSTHQFIHPVADVVQALLDAGLRLTMLHEHDTLAWKAYASMVETEGRLYRLPGRPWLPLSYSLKAMRD